MKSKTDEEYIRHDKWTARLLKKHQEILAAGFKPSTLQIVSPDAVIHETCAVCDYSGLLGIIEWYNPQTDKYLYTGFDCFARVAKNLKGIDAGDLREIRWTAEHRELFEGGKWTIMEVGHIRLAFYKNPMSKVYGGNWSKAVEDVYPHRNELKLSDFQLAVLETLHTRSGQYWTWRSPTPRQTDRHLERDRETIPQSPSGCDSR